MNSQSVHSVYTPRDSLDVAAPASGVVAGKRIGHAKFNHPEDNDEDFEADSVEGDEEEYDDRDDDEVEEEDYEDDANIGLNEQQKVYVDYPHDKEDDNEYRFVSSRIGDETDDANTKAYGAQQRELQQQQQHRHHHRYQAMDLSPTGEFSHRHGTAAEPLPVYGQKTPSLPRDRSELEAATENKADSDLAGEIRYQAEMQRRLDLMASQMAKLDKRGTEDGGVPRLDLLHMEDATASQQHLYRDSLDIDLRDNDTEETDEDETAVGRHPKPSQLPSKHRKPAQDLSSHRRAEIDHVTRLSRQLGGLQIEPDYYDSGRNPPSESAAADTTGRSAAAAAAIPTAEDLEFLRKLKRDLVYGGQAGPHQQLMDNEASPIRPESLRQPLPQVKHSEQQQAIKKQQQQSRSKLIAQQQQQQQQQQLLSDKDFVEENKKLPTNRLPTKSYGKIYREKREKPQQRKVAAVKQQQQQQPQQQQQRAPQQHGIALDESLEVTHLDDQSPSEQVWMSRMAALQSLGSGTQQRKQQASGTVAAVAAAGAVSKQTSADPRLQGLQQKRQQHQRQVEEIQRHSVPIDRMMHGADEETLARAEAYNWPYQQQQQQPPPLAHYVTAYDVNGQPVTVPVAAPMPPPQAFVYPYQAAFPVYGVPPMMPPSHLQQQQQQYVMMPQMQQLQQQQQQQQQQQEQQQQQQQQLYRQSPRVNLSQSFDAAATAASPRMVVDESTLNRQFKYVGTKLAGTMSRSPPGKYNPLPPIPGGGGGGGAVVAKRIDSKELDKLTKTIIATTVDSHRHQERPAATRRAASQTSGTEATETTEDRTVTELQFESSASGGYLSEEVSGYSSKFQQAATSPGYTPYSVSDFQNLKSVASLGGLGHDKENDGYRISHQLYKKKQQYAKAINERNRVTMVTADKTQQPQQQQQQQQQQVSSRLQADDKPKIEQQQTTTTTQQSAESKKDKQEQTQQQQQQQRAQQIDSKTGQTLSEAEFLAKQEAQGKRMRMKQYSKSLQNNKQQQQQQQQTQSKKPPVKSNHQQQQKSSADVDKLLHDPELERQMQRHLEDKKRSETIRQQVTAS